MNEIHWGLLVASYLFLAGSGAGALFVSGYYVIENKIQDEKYFNLAKYSALLGAVLLSVGVGMIVLDLTTFRHGIENLEFDKIFRFVRLFMTFVPGSIMSIGTWLLAIAIPIAFAFVCSFTNIYNFSTYRSLLAKINMFFAICIASYTAFLLGDVTHNLVWNNSVLVILFLFSALSSGIAIVTLVKVALWKKANVSQNEATNFAKADIIVLSLELLSIIVFAYTVYAITAANKISYVLTLDNIVGQLWWIGALGLGLILPLILNIQAIVNNKPLSHVKEYLLITSILVGAFCLRYSVLLAGQWN
jgi:formate-dependent nitrite reductase membrane component NrfD